MKNTTRSSKAKLRTTVTLPARVLRQAKQVARSRNVNLSTVVSEAVEKDLKHQADALRPEDVLEGYRKAFAGFSEEELMILDGIILQPVRKRR